MEEKIIVDQLNRQIRINYPPKRIISTVPSQTELLYDLGLNEEVIAITKFCIHPEEWFKSKTRIGGTKKLNIEKIKSLMTDLGFIINDFKIEKTNVINQETFKLKVKEFFNNKNNRALFGTNTEIKEKNHLEATNNLLLNYGYEIKSKRIKVNYNNFIFISI